MNRLVAVNGREDIPPQYRDTAIEKLLEYHEFGRPYDTYTTAELLVGMCMDHREHLHIPGNFAYILRAGGANLRPSEFKVSYAVSVGGIRAIALIGHTNCGMVNLMSRQAEFVQGLVDVGWDKAAAEAHFLSLSPIFEIGNEVDFVLSEAKRLRLRYPKVLVAPLMFHVDDDHLYLVKE